MLKRLVYYTLLVDLFFLVIGILFYNIQVGGPIVEVFFSLLILIVVIAVPSFPIAIGLLIAEILSFFTVGRLRQVYRKIPSRGKSKKFQRRLLGLILTEEEEENIIGDLREECSQFQSKIKGRIWLYKQVLKSALPLVYKNIKSRLASRFGERVR